MLTTLLSYTNWTPTILNIHMLWWVNNNWPLFDLYSIFMCLCYFLHHKFPNLLIYEIHHTVRQSSLQSSYIFLLCIFISTLFLEILNMQIFKYIFKTSGILILIDSFNLLNDNWFKLMSHIRASGWYWLTLACFVIKHVLHWSYWAWGCSPQVPEMKRSSCNSFQRWLLGGISLKL